MTRSHISFVALFALLLSSPAFARGGGNILRGGLGFLFPDHNSFSNPGQFAATNGMAVEALYGTSEGTGASQLVKPSYVYGNGSFGLGFYGARSGSNLSTGPTTVGVGLGFAMLKNRATIGVGFDKPLGAGAADGDLSVTLTMNPANRRGAAFGLGYKNVLGSGLHALTAGLGFSFSSNNNMEMNVSWADIGNLGTFDGLALFTMQKRFFYLSGGYAIAKNITTLHGATGRLGFIIGTSMDISAYAMKYFVTGGGPLSYGASLRASF